MKPPKVARARGVVPSTPERTVSDDGHFPPAGWRDRTGARWRGTSRVVRPAERQRHNRRTWRALLVEARRTTVAAQREGCAR